MKKLLSCLLAIVLVLVTIFMPVSAYAKTSPDGTYAAKKDLKLNSTKKTLYVNATYKLKLSATVKPVMWKSTDDNVATVDKSGLVTAVAPGKATITATVGAGNNNKKLSCIITVKSKLSTNCNKNVMYCPLDEIGEVLITFTDLVEGENIYADSSGITQNLEFEYGERDGDVLPIYIYPPEQGVYKLKVMLGNQKKGSDFPNFYDPVTITIYAGIGEHDWVDNKTLSSLLNVTNTKMFSNNKDDESVISLLYHKDRNNDKDKNYTGGLVSYSECFEIILESSEPQYDTVYLYEGLHYKFTDKNTILYSMDDLRTLGIID